MVRRLRTAHSASEGVRVSELRASVANLAYQLLMFYAFGYSMYRVLGDVSTATVDGWTGALAVAALITGRSIVLKEGWK
jgi:hypothetical protein